MQIFGKNIFEKINLTRIVSDHTKTLINQNKKQSTFDDYFTFLIIPISISFILVYFGFFLDLNMVSLICTSLSIFVGLLLNIIVLLFDLVSKDQYPNKTQLLKEMLSNISFTIVLSVLCILFSFPCLIDHDITTNMYGVFPYCKAALIWIFHLFEYFLLAEFLMTLLMILKRMYALFADEIEKKGS